MRPALPLKVALVSGIYETRFKTLDELIAQYFHVRLLAQNLSALGHQVTVVQSFHEDTETRLGAVKVKGVPHKMRQSPESGTGKLKRWATGNTGVDSSGVKRLALAVTELEPDVVHFFGLKVWQELAQSAAAARSLNAVVSWSDHGGQPERHPLLTLKQRKAFSGTDVAFFPSPARVDIWRKSIAWPKGCETYCQPEATSDFRLMPREDTRKKTGMFGKPVICWTANLVPDKRPMLALEAFELVLDVWPEARLYMAYRFDDMQTELQNHVDQSDRLKSSVIFLGQLQLDEIEKIYNSADIFLTTTRREVGSISLSEAFACGVQPVYTDLPSLRELTEDGTLGCMVQDQTAEGYARAILSLDQTTTENQRKKLRRHFDQNMGYAAIANRHVEAWQKAIARKKA